MEIRALQNEAPSLSVRVGQPMSISIWPCCTNSNCYSMETESASYAMVCCVPRKWRKALKSLTYFGHWLCTQSNHISTICICIHLGLLEYSIN